MIKLRWMGTPDGLILGTPGAGKSFSAKREITNAFFVTEDDIIRRGTPLLREHYHSLRGVVRSVEIRFCEGEGVGRDIGGKEAIYG